jgi:hypothetical protein
MDKKLHFLFGLATAAFSLISMFIFVRFGAGWSVFFSCASIGIGYEIQQAVRKEGQPEVLDALATALPGFIFLIGWTLLK